MRRWNSEANDIFFRALQRTPQPARSRFLDEECRGDPHLRAQVEELLAASDGAGDFLDTPPTEVAAAIKAIDDSQAPPETPGNAIGPYRLLERIGEGGFGEVWTAEQRQPVRRKVALKIIKAGMDSREVLARFEAERQALALMDHPNVARVFDAGQSEAGRPYFVMEHAAGLPVTDYCDAGRLRIRQRLELFTQVCHAVQHAHTKGIIHRDLKPSNILVTLVDGKPVPKVIDFGIAKATTTPLTERTLHTEAGRLMGTPEYMSPEQAGTSGIDVDTRSDVYALGVILYQLLTGTLPFDPKMLRSAGYDGIVKIIREMEPPRPSTRLSTISAEPVNQQNGAAPPEIAARRDTDFAALQRQLRGELDWIVMKCLEKDRTRRYETANSLASDVQRHLAGEPVVAAPPSRLYSLSKTVRRHRTAVAVATSFVVLVAAALVATSTLWRQATHARDAESDQRARAEAINTFMKDMLTAAEPAKAKGAKLTVREALDTAAKGIEQSAVKDQPLVEAEIRFTIGSTYFALGLYPEAEAQLRAADAIQSRELGDEHRDTLRTRSKLVAALTNKSDYADAASLARSTFEVQRRLFGPDDPDTLTSMVLLGSSMWVDARRIPEAESLLQSAIERLQRVRGPDHEETANAMNCLGEFYLGNSCPEKAQPLYLEALRIQTKARGEEHPATLECMGRVAGTLINQGRLQEAEAMCLRALEPSIRLLGPEYMWTLNTQIHLATSVYRQGRSAEAETIYCETIAIFLRTVGPDHANTIHAQRMLADLLIAQGRYSEGEKLVRELLDTARARYGPDDADSSLRILSLLVKCLAKQGKDAETESVARQLLEFQRRQWPRPNPPEFKNSCSALIEVLKRRGAHDEALLIEQELIEFWLAAASAPDASANFLNAAAHWLLFPSDERLRDAPKALPFAQRAYERSGGQHPSYLRTLAQAHMLTGDPKRAAEVWKEAVEILTDDPVCARLLNGAAWELLTVTPETLRSPTAALELARKANELSHYNDAPQLDTLALACHQTGDTAKAIELQKKALALLVVDAPDRAEYENRLTEFERALDRRPADP